MTLPRRAFLASLLAAPFIPKFAMPKEMPRYVVPWIEIDPEDWRHAVRICNIDASTLTAMSPLDPLWLDIQNYNKRQTT